MFAFTMTSLISSSSSTQDSLNRVPLITLRHERGEEEEGQMIKKEEERGVYRLAMSSLGSLCSGLLQRSMVFA
jgi:hypothetical protein